MKILIKKDWKYTLFINDVGAHVLTVICGSIGIYEIEHELTTEELTEYQQQGEEFVDALASKISYYPNSYQKK
ncbi:hypothetical protein [Kordia sp.]|uniref:hypothetical protein n=1 Tax=Kordia sp. TaxID=1965332 RepID=UPI003B5CC84D